MTAYWTFSDWESSCRHDSNASTSGKRFSSYRRISGWIYYQFKYTVAEILDYWLTSTIWPSNRSNDGNWALQNWQENRWEVWAMTVPLHLERWRLMSFIGRLHWLQTLFPTSLLCLDFWWRSKLYFCGKVFPHDSTEQRNIFFESRIKYDFSSVINLDSQSQTVETKKGSPLDKYGCRSVGLRALKRLRTNIYKNTSFVK